MKTARNRNGEQENTYFRAVRQDLDASLKIQLDQLTTPFDLERTLRCGQSFRWKKLGDWWYGVAYEKTLKVKQVDDELLFQTFPEGADPSFAENYFRLDDDLPHLLSRISKDDYIKAAIRSFTGLRIIRQQPWECLISYICATHINIPAIKNIILNLSRRFGKKMAFNHHDFYTFPKPNALANADIEQMKECKLGFRAERVLETAKIIHDEKLDLEALRNMGYEHARSRLLSLPGVGPKVADCVLLFALDKLEAFPVDVWVRRTILEHYSNHFTSVFINKMRKRKSPAPREYEDISLFGRRYFGKYAGYAQEYLFAHARSQLKTSCT